MQRRRVALASRKGGPAQGARTPSERPEGSPRATACCSAAGANAGRRLPASTPGTGRECVLKSAGFEAVIGAKLASPSARHGRAPNQARLPAGVCGRVGPGEAPGSATWAHPLRIRSPRRRPLGQNGQRQRTLRPADRRSRGLEPRPALVPPDKVTRPPRRLATKPSQRPSLPARGTGDRPPPPAHQRPASAPVPASGGTALQPQAIPKPAIGTAEDMYRPGVAFPETLQGPCAGVGLLELPPLTPCPTNRTTRTPAGRRGPRECARLPGPSRCIRGG